MLNIFNLIYQYLLHLLIFYSQSDNKDDLKQIELLLLPGVKGLCLDLCLEDESSVLLSMRTLPLLREAGLCPDRSPCLVEGLPGGP